MKFFLSLSLLAFTTPLIQSSQYSSRSTSPTNIQQLIKHSEENTSSPNSPRNISETASNHSQSTSPRNNADVNTQRKTPSPINPTTTEKTTPNIPHVTSPRNVTEPITDSPNSTPAIDDFTSTNRFAITDGQKRTLIIAASAVIATGVTGAIVKKKTSCSMQ